MMSPLICIAIMSAVAISVNGFMGYPKRRTFHAVPEPHDNDTDTVKLGYIDQRVDNFNPQNHDTYRMRYFRNDEYFEENGPIFILVGGEWEIEAGWLKGGLLFQIARHHHAQMFYVEHRYYGQSHPTKDASTENLRYLSLDQTLADLANFINAMKKEPGKENSKVILNGVSYGASTAVWFRQKFPHLCDGVWASSAPLLGKIDLYEYKEVIGHAFRDIGGDDCYSLIKNAFKQAEQLISDGHFKTFRRTFRLCKKFNADDYLDIWAAFCLLSDVLAGVVQYHKPGDIEGVCTNLLNNLDNSTEIDSFGDWFITYMAGDDDDCIKGDYKATIEYFRDERWTSDALKDNNRQWVYETCTEFGWYQTSDSSKQPFGSNFPVALNYKACADIFGKKLFTNETMDKSVDRTNYFYGGKNPAVRNVYFTQGGIDPWRPVGIQSDLNSYSPADIITNSSHAQDIYNLKDSDTEEMQAAKKRVRKLYKKWIEQ